jgi:hypothetical protein
LYRRFAQVEARRNVAITGDFINSRAGGWLFGTGYRMSSQVLNLELRSITESSINVRLSTTENSPGPALAL